jgi:hypothetical protein
MSMRKKKDDEESKKKQTKGLTENAYAEFEI